MKRLTKWQRFLNIFKQKEYCLGYSKPSRPFPNKTIIYDNTEKNSLLKTNKSGKKKSRKKRK